MANTRMPASAARCAVGRHRRGARAAPRATTTPRSRTLTLTTSSSPAISSSASSSSPTQGPPVDDGDGRRHGAAVAHRLLDLARDPQVVRARQPVADDRRLERDHRVSAGQRARTSGDRRTTGLLMATMYDSPAPSRPAFRVRDRSVTGVRRRCPRGWHRGRTAGRARLRHGARAGGRRRSRRRLPEPLGRRRRAPRRTHGAHAPDPSRRRRRARAVPRLAVGGDRLLPVLRPVPAPDAPRRAPLHQRRPRRPGRARGDGRRADRRGRTLRAGVPRDGRARVHGAGRPPGPRPRLGAARAPRGGGP